MAGFWKDGVQCVVNIGFDVDGVSSWLGRDGDFANRPVATTMAEYGPKVGMPRILSLLDEYGIKGSFFVPGHTAENHPHIVPDLLARGHEIAHHGYIHERPAALDEGEERRALETGLEILERQSGTRVPGYRSPSWDISPRTLDLLVEYGFTYDSSLMDDDAPYVHDVAELASPSCPSMASGRFSILGLRTRRRSPRTPLQPRGRHPHLDHRVRHSIPRRQMLHSDPSPTGLGPSE